MRKRFNTLNKQIEDNRIDIIQIKEEEQKLTLVILKLENTFKVLKKEVYILLYIVHQERRINSRKRASSLWI